MKYFAIITLLFSGCIVTDPDRFQLGGEVRVETGGILEYIVPVKVRIFGGMTIERKVADDDGSTEGDLPIDALARSVDQ